MGKVATSPLQSRGVHNAKRGAKSTSGYLALAVKEAHMWAKGLRNPCRLGGPQRQAWGENQKWLPNPCCSGGPHVGKGAT